MFVTRVDPASSLAREQFEYSPDWAGLVFERTAAALEVRAYSIEANASTVTGARM